MSIMNKASRPVRRLPRECRFSELQEGYMGIPILLYHALYDRESNRERYSIRKEAFEDQMRYLSETGVQSLLLDEFFSIQQASERERKKIAITFDDGNESDYSIALPILKKYGLKATFFITVERISKNNYLSWSQLMKMNDHGMSIQSHGLTHAFLNCLTEGDAQRELLESKQEIQGRLGTEVNYFSLPGGFSSPFVLDLVEEAGYQGVCTSGPGLNLPGPGGEGLRIFKRMNMTKRISLGNFQRAAGGKRGYVARRRAEDLLKNGFKRVLGSNAYYSIWSKFFKYD